MSCQTFRVTERITHKMAPSCVVETGTGQASRIVPILAKALISLKKYAIDYFFGVSMVDDKKDLARILTDTY